MLNKENFFHFQLSCRHTVIDSVGWTLRCGKDERRPIVLACLNPHSFVTAQRDRKFTDALYSADHLVCDGIGVKVVGNILLGSKIERFTGPDMFEAIMRQAELIGAVRVFFIGGSLDALTGILERVKIDFPNVVCGGYSPPYKEEFSKADNEAILEKVAEFAPDIVWVGLSAPKQEKWVAENLDRINCKVISSIGAVFDFYSGTIKRAPTLLRFLGLEWFWRSILDPKRLGKRNLISNPRFLYESVKAFLQRNKDKSV